MTKQLGIAERAVYERLRKGPLLAGEASLFTRQIGALVAARIARRTPEGGVELINSTQAETTSPSVTPPSESGTMPAALPTITARVPQAVLEYLDAMGLESRGAALRAVFAELLAKQNQAIARRGSR